jgi:hypothetical protein
MTGATMQPEFNRNVDKQPMNNYAAPVSGGALQDMLRTDDTYSNANLPTGIPDEPSDVEDTTLTRKEIAGSITSPEFTNEKTYIDASLKEIKRNSTTAP